MLNSTSLKNSKHLYPVEWLTTHLVCNIQRIVIWCETNVRLLLTIRPENRSEKKDGQMKQRKHGGKSNLCKQVYIHNARLNSGNFLCHTLNQSLILKLFCSRWNNSNIWICILNSEINYSDRSLLSPMTQTTNLAVITVTQCSTDYHSGMNYE